MRYGTSMRIVLSVTMFAFVVSIGVFLGTGAQREQAAALGVPSQLPFHQRVPIVARDGSGDVSRADLDAAELRWARSGSANYRVTVSWGELGPRERHTLYVTDGVVIEVQSECFSGPDQIACGVVDQARYTVPGIFALLRAKVAAQGAVGDETPGAPFVNARYDPEFGYPVEFTYGARFVPDAATRWEIEDFQLVY